MKKLFKYTNHIGNEVEIEYYHFTNIDDYCKHYNLDLEAHCQDFYDKSYATVLFNDPDNWQGVVADITPRKNIDGLFVKNKEIYIFNNRKDAIKWDSRNS